MAIDEPVRRLRRPTWRDPRLGVGVLLVAGSVALGTWAVRDAADTVDVYAARDAVTPGDPLQDAVVVQQVRLGANEDLYVRAEEGLPDGAVALRTVGPGELVPRSAVGDAEGLAVRPVVVPVGTAVPADLGAGSVVDLWLTPPPPTAGASATAAATEPVLLAADLVVSDVVEDSSMFGGGTGVSVELLVPSLDLSTVLDALSQDGELVVVPTFGKQQGAPDRSEEDSSDEPGPALPSELAPDARS